MKIILQKVSQASVTIDSQVISSIQKGYMLLVGISTYDTKADIDKLARKGTNLRRFTEDFNKVRKRKIKDIDGEILSVSQFTLYAKTTKGNKPDFHKAQKGELALELYNYFISNLRKELGTDKVKDGKFGSIMSCSLVNEGPVTIILDSKQ